MVKLDFDLQRDVPDLTSKVLLITGGKLAGSISCNTMMKWPLMSYSGTHGLGAAAAKMLSSRNPAKIYITGRKEDAAQQTISDIKSAGSTAKVEWISCDHADLYSVRETAEKIKARESRLDVLMANAGISKLFKSLSVGLMIMFPRKAG